MFLKKTMERNPKLIDEVIKLHQNGEISPDSFIVDLDNLRKNAKIILDKANNYDIDLYYMLKQLGHNPYIGKILTELGYSGAVSVDFRETEVLMNNNLPISNVGHLVQIPDYQIEEVLKYGVKYVTIYSMEKLRLINELAKKLGIVQNIMIRLTDDSDFIYPGQTAGFSLEELEELSKISKKELKNICISGVTSFPCYLYDENIGDIVSTPNLETVFRGKEILEGLGHKINAIDTPSTTCSRTLDLMKEDGSNIGEPGHGLTGTTPLHAYKNLEEIPCVIYLSEISHNFDGKAYAFGGGHYRRSRLKNALVVDKKDNR